MSSIRSAFFWNSIRQIGLLGIQLLSTILLARYLFPEDYVLIGIISIFLQIANVLVDAGMGGALIKKQKVSNLDYSTLFIYNFLVSSLLYIVIFFLAPFIADFYKKDIIISLLRIQSLSIIFQAIAIVPNVKLLKEMNFRVLAFISLFSGCISFIIALYLAMKSWGAWALVYQQLSSVILMTVLCICFSNKRFGIRFSLESFKEQFSFGMNIVLASGVNIIANNISNNVIAKIYPSIISGNFVQANRINIYPVTFLASIIDRTVFPIYATITEKEKLLREYKHLTSRAYYALFPFFFVISFMFPKIIPIILGEKWYDTGLFLQILSFSWAPLVMQSFARNLFKSKGNTRRILKNEIFSCVNIGVFLVIGTCICFEAVLYALVISQYLNMIYVMLFVKKEIKYSFSKQIADFLLPLIFALLFGWLISSAINYII